MVSATEDLVHKAHSEICSVMKTHWEWLLGMHGGYVAVHTLLVLWRASVHLPAIYEPLPDNEKNIIQWACLLHDIRKLGAPVIEGKDHIHPFKSAVAVLEVFKQIGVLDLNTDELRFAYD